MFVVVHPDRGRAQHPLDVGMRADHDVEQASPDAGFLEGGMHGEVADVAVERSVGPAAQDAGQGRALPGADDERGSGVRAANAVDVIDGPVERGGAVEGGNRLGSGPDTDGVGDHARMLQVGAAVGKSTLERSFPKPPERPFRPASRPGLVGAE